MPPTIPTSLKLPAELKAAIDEDARKQGTCRSDLDSGPQNLLQRPEQLLLQGDHGAPGSAGKPYCRSCRDTPRQRRLGMVFFGSFSMNRNEA